MVEHHQSIELPVLNFNRDGLTDQDLLLLYNKLIYPRLIEEKMLILLRQGKVSKWFSGIGQEAISVAATLALLDDELIFTMHRNLGVFTSRNVPLDRLICQWQGTESGFSKGRERSFHFGTFDYGIVGMISHLGPQLSLAGGVALAHTLKQENRASIVFTGEGGTSQGEFHEALNVASVWNLPVIFVVENNGYGLSTPTNEQFKCQNIADRAIGYGMKSYIIDGNNIIETYRTFTSILNEIRENPAPILLECRTFRMRGHEEASGTKYVPQEMLDLWAKRDPIENFENYILSLGIVDESQISEIKSSLKREINAAVDKAFLEQEIIPDTNLEMDDVYKSYRSETITPDPTLGVSKLRFVDAISDAMNLAMLKHSNLVLMGQDIAEYGGVFKVTDGFVEKFGKSRVRNTPLCESAIIGIALGLSFKGFKSMVEMQFADFVTCGFNQIVNNLAKINYRWGANADVVIRMPTGAGVGAGPFHSQSNEAWFFHTPGLKVVYPSNPYDAKGLLLASFDDPNPVMYFEHKGLYRSLTDEIPQGYYTVEIGKANVVQSGNQLSIVTYGMGVHWAIEATKELNISAEILDLRTLLPLDYDAIDAVVKKTNRVLILHEDTLIGGIGGEISAYISEFLFEHLDAPVKRIASLDTPIPFAKSLEKNFLPTNRLKPAIIDLLNY